LGVEVGTGVERSPRRTDSRQVASKLFVSERIVVTHVGRIFKKLEVHSRDRVKDLLPDQGQATLR
jgi:Bacterial regulatory proteins, luxR family